MLSVIGSILPPQYALPLSGVALLSLLVWQTVRHRWHLQQVGAWVGRLHRLDRRVAFCVADLDQLALTPRRAGVGFVEEEVVGHLDYLRAIRIECGDLALEVALHPYRRRWFEDSLERLSPASRRCAQAHARLSDAAEQLASAVRVFEKCAGDRTSAAGRREEGDAALAFLHASDVPQLIQSRLKFERAMIEIRAILYPDPVFTPWEATWAVFRSELSRKPCICGDVKPMSWVGMGDRERMNVDAR